MMTSRKRPPASYIADRIEEEAEALKQDYLLQKRSRGHILSYRWARWQRANGQSLYWDAPIAERKVTQ